VKNNIVFDWRTFAGAAILLSALPCEAQNVLQAQAQYQPLTYTDDKGYKGCGVHAMVLVDDGAHGLTGADVSVNFWMRPDMMGIAKVAYLEGNPPGLKKIAPEKFSLSLEADGVPLKFPIFQKAETAGYLIAPTSVDDAFGLIVAMVKGERVVVGIGVKGWKTEVRYVFEAKLDPKDFKSFSACLDQVIK
jgi:hypothetical protein